MLEKKKPPPLYVYLHVYCATTLSPEFWGSQIVRLVSKEMYKSALTSAPSSSSSNTALNLTGSSHSHYHQEPHPGGGNGSCSSSREEYSHSYHHHHGGGDRSPQASSSNYSRSQSSPVGMASGASPPPFPSSPPSSPRTVKNLSLIHI